MVLHQNKWDRKATRAHVRKLGVKEGNTKKPRAGEKEGGGAGVDKKEFPTLSRDTEGDGEDEDDIEEGGKGEKEDEEGESGGEHGSGEQFSRRKMHSNSWRYEQEEELAPGEEPEEAELEPDYVAMTRERKGQLEKPEDPLKEDLDEEFLKDLHAQGGTGRGRGGSTHGGFGGTKGKVVKVDRKQFEDATTKMAKQSTADAFRRRFASRKAKSRGASGGTGGADSGEDVDSFLEELKLDGETEIAASHAAGRETSSKLGGSRTSEGYGYDKDDNWLDSMLGGR